MFEFICALHIVQQKRDTKTEIGTHTNTVIETKRNSKFLQNKLKICRVCLNVGKVPIYGPDGKDNLAEILSVISGIKSISRLDNYPKHLCLSCLGVLRNAMLFRKTALKSDKLLHSRISKEHNFTVAKEHSPKTNQTMCSICKCMFKTSGLARHMFMVHKKGYVCEVCGKMFRSVAHLNSHNIIHKAELPHKCQQCPYEGRSKSLLKSHMKIHSEEKSHACTHCPAKFRTSSNLIRHTYKHTQQKDYICEDCGKAYITKSDLVSHKKVFHAGLREHICDICGYAFGRKKALRHHQIKIHKSARFNYTGRQPLYLKFQEQNSTSLDTN